MLKNSLTAAFEPFEDLHLLHFEQKSCSNLVGHTLSAPRVDWWADFFNTQERYRNRATVKPASHTGLSAQV